MVHAFILCVPLCSDTDRARSELDEARLQLQVLLHTVEALQSTHQGDKDERVVELTTQLCVAHAREAALERRAGDLLVGGAGCLRAACRWLALYAFPCAATCAF